MSGSITSALSSTINGLSTSAPTTQVGPQANDANMNEFLQLLTTQLQNQDPMQPTDPTQFVAQLAQFSTVEQLTQSNTTLTNINQALSGMALGQYAGLINHTVNANVSAVTVPASGNVSTNMNYQITSSALKNVQVTIRNAAGTVVGALPVTGNSGSLTFNGITSTGQTLAPGQYSVALTGTDATGTSQTAGTLAVSGSVSSVVQDATGGWQLQLGDGSVVAATAVTSVN